MTADAAPLLRLTGIDKSYPGVQALRSVSLDVRAGEVHALVGENGAGKSTLIRIATGAHRPDAGTCEVNGVPLDAGGPADSFRAGVAAIYQEFNLIPALTIRENLFLGREEGRHGILHPREESRRAREVLRLVAAEIDPESVIRDLPVAQQQLVEIARALLAEARILILDEPTAALSPREVDSLFAVLGDLKRQGRGILFITHRLEEVFRIADRVTVLRDGCALGTWPAPELTREKLIELMVGRSLGYEFPPRSDVTRRARVLLRVKDLRGNRVRGVSFDLHEGEVLGLAGLVGAGRTDLARLLFGADPPDSGGILLEGRPFRPRSPRDAIRRGVCLLTEDRKAQGLVLGLSALENFSLPNLERWSHQGWIRRRVEAEAFLRSVKNLHIRLASPEQEAGHLSGGNQQKLLVARWLVSESKVILFDEPTRGIDVGAKREMYQLIRELAGHGKGILMISSELPEILGLSDRVLVMRAGKLAGEITDVAAAGQEDVLAPALL